MFEQNKALIKILLKDTFKPYSCGLSVKVNDISDGVYFETFTNKVLLHQKETAINMQNRVISQVSGGSYCNCNANSGTET